MAPSRSGRGAIAAAAVLLAALTGCTGTSEPPATGSLPDGLSAEFVQLRSDVAARQAQLQLRNDTSESIEVGAVAVTDPRFTDDAARLSDRSSVLPSGATVDIRIQLPAMDCDAATGEPAVLLALTVDGRQSRVAGPLADPLDVIGPLHERECLAERLADAAALTFAEFRPSPPGVPAALVLSIAPTGREAALIGGIQTTNLLTFAAAPGDTADTFPIAVEVRADDSHGSAVDLPLVPLRCDPHAVQEDKRGTIFTLEVEVDGEPGEIELAAPEELRGRILTWVADWCGFGGG